MARRVGVLAVQGGFAAHVRALRDIGLEALEVRSAADLDAVDGLVLPGGESTAQLTLIEALGLGRALTAFVSEGRPVLCTCAGLILAATRVVSPEQESFGFLDVTVVRNAYGTQQDSFEGVADDGRTLIVCIRAPKIARVGPDVSVLATLGGEPVLVRQGAVIGATFHPELTSDRSVHEAAFGATG